jgi:RimJ/RimL family protein N-acetyltransferase
MSKTRKNSKSMKDHIRTFLMEYYNEPIIRDGSIHINDKSYKYKLFNTLGLIELIRHNSSFTNRLEEAIKLYRKNDTFEISDLVTEYIYYRSDHITLYYIVYNAKDIVSTVRFYLQEAKKTAYFNMVYTNPEYRGQKICQTNIQALIDSSNKTIKTYELEVDANNPAAIKCYENIGFKKIKTYELEKDHSYYLMRLKSNIVE